MHRTDLLAKLASYNPYYAEEIKAKDDIFCFVSTYPDCFQRSLSIGHITASAWLLNHDQSQFLLTHHAKLDKWLQLGGHCDGNPDVLSVAIKEAQEESGIINIKPISTDIFDLDVHLIPAHRQEPAHYHYDIRFLLQVTGDIPFIKSSESKDLAWFNRTEPLPTSERSVMRMIEKWQQMQAKLRSFLRSTEFTNF